jgi:hypothetical protein
MFSITQMKPAQEPRVLSLRLVEVLSRRGLHIYPKFIKNAPGQHYGAIIA